MKIVVVWLLPLATIATASAQPAAPSKDSKPKNSAVHVRGCLHGTELAVSEDQGFVLPGGNVLLKGGRQLMNAVREHNGHEVEVVGVLKTSRQDAVAIKEKRGDRTRVYVGASEHRGGTPDTPAVEPVLDVRELTPIAPVCR
jgi:hypothetical protein